MNTHTLRTLLIVLCSFMTAVLPSAAQTEYVNPFIGTGAVDGGLSGNCFPGAAVPFGFVQLSPDTREVPNWDCAPGYDYNDAQIYGFSHTHLSGTGVSDLCDVLLMPGRSPQQFSHADESARPGYYAVRLADDDVLAELTATAHCGLHRYTFSASGADAPSILIDLEHSAKKGDWGRRIEKAQLRIVDAYTVEGYRIITGWAPLRSVYFCMKFSQPISDYDTPHHAATLNGTDVRARLSFAGARQVEVRVGLSPVDYDGARRNLQAETAGKSFDEICSAADTTWRDALSAVSVTMPSDAEREIFYTALYHAMLQPNVISDADGRYVGPDYVIRRADGGAEYSTFSIWDTFRAAHPLYTIIAPQRAAEFVNSMLDHCEAYGYLPIWQLWGQENYCMIGNHAVPIVADAVMKGLPGIDARRALWAVRQSLTTPHVNFPADVWARCGYMPEDVQSQSVSLTLEASYDDWCAAQLTDHLGLAADSVGFRQRALNYRALWNAESGFFQPRNAAGEWMQPFDPYVYGANGGNPFTEGNAWQWLWYVPHDTPWLIEAMGGKKKFAARLDEFFTSTRTSGAKNDNASGFVGIYAHGNEPSHHAPWLYVLAGQSEKSDRLIDHIRRTLYNTSSSGYAGNDDCGEMSAWYVFAALGFYPVNPCGGDYVICAPAVDSAEIHLADGKTFSIRTVSGRSRERIISRMTLNGQPLRTRTLKHSGITAGGELVVYLK